jgi:hypothetical protein
MKKRTCISLCLLSVLAPPATALDTSVEYNHTVDFARLATYVWAEGTPAKHADIQKLIVGAVDDELAGLGMRRVEGTADVQVSVHVLVDLHTLKELDDPDSWEYWTGVTSVTAADVKAGTLVLDLVDPASGDVIWRGLSSGAVNAVPMKNQKKVIKSIRKLLAQLPRDGP